MRAIHIRLSGIATRRSPSPFPCSASGGARPIADGRPNHGCSRKQLICCGANDIIAGNETTRETRTSSSFTVQPRSEPYTLDPPRFSLETHQRNSPLHTRARERIIIASC